MQQAAEQYLAQGNTNAAAQIFRTLSKKPSSSPSASSSDPARLAAYCDVLTSSDRFPLKRAQTLLVEAVLDPLIPPMALFFGYMSDRLSKGAQLPPLSTYGANGIRKAGKKLLLSVHPDKNPHPKAVEAATRLLSLQQQLEDKLEAGDGGLDFCASPTASHSPASSPFYTDHATTSSPVFSPNDLQKQKPNDEFGAGSPSMTSPPSFSRAPNLSTASRSRRSPKSKTAGGKPKSKKGDGKEFDSLLSTMRSNKGASCKLRCDLSMESVLSPSNANGGGGSASVFQREGSSMLFSSTEEEEMQRQPSASGGFGTSHSTTTTTTFRSFRLRGQGGGEGRPSDSDKGRLSSSSTGGGGGGGVQPHPPSQSSSSVGDSPSKVKRMSLSVGSNVSRGSMGSEEVRDRASGGGSLLSTVDSIINAHIESAYDDFESGSRRSTDDSLRQSKVRALSESLLEAHRQQSGVPDDDDDRGGLIGSSQQRQNSDSSSSFLRSTTTSSSTFVHLPPVSSTSPSKMSREPDPRSSRSGSHGNGVERRVVANAGAEDEQVVLSVSISHKGVGAQQGVASNTEQRDRLLSQVDQLQAGLQEARRQFNVVKLSRDGILNTDSGRSGRGDGGP